VEFRGIQIGRVVDVKLVYNGATNGLEIPVVIEIEPERIGLAGEADVDPMLRLQRLVTRGLRAQLQTGSLLTGTLIVDLDFREGSAAAVLKHKDAPYPELPTVPTQLEAITSSATAFLNKLQRVPLEQIGASANEAVASLKQTLDQTRELAQSVQKDVVPGIGRAMAEAERVLQNSNRLVGSESPLNVELRKMMVELTDAARSMRLFADHLERHPEDLIRGRSHP
jgi:paraquat-inducible protein B